MSFANFLTELLQSNDMVGPFYFELNSENQLQWTASENVRNEAASLYFSGTESSKKFCLNSEDLNNDPRPFKATLALLFRHSDLLQNASIEFVLCTDNMPAANSLVLNIATLSYSYPRFSLLLFERKSEERSKTLEFFKDCAELDISIVTLKQLQLHHFLNKDAEKLEDFFRLVFTILPNLEFLALVTDDKEMEELFEQKGTEVASSMNKNVNIVAGEESDFS